MDVKGQPGRKPKENPLRVTNFRLSNQDLKLIDKKGIGKNSSERLRYIIENYKTPKLSISKRRKAYRSRKFSDYDDATAFFESLVSTWGEKEKLEFLCQTSLRNDILSELEELYRWKIRTLTQINKLEQYGWSLIQSTFVWEKNRTVVLNVTLKKGSKQIILAVADESDEYIIEEDIDNAQDDFSAKEEDLISLLYEELQEMIFSSDFTREERISDYKKVYPSGDYYRTIEYNHVIVIEMEHSITKAATVVNFIKELIPE